MTNDTPVPREEDKLIAQALIKESDRGCVILAAALLAEALEDLLRSFFRNTVEDRATINPLFQGYAPLATFSARIQVAFALAILSHEERDTIELVRRLRNDFAHEWGPIDFNDPRCASRLELIIGRLKHGPYNEDESEIARLGLGILAPTKEQLVTRIVFVMTIIHMTGRLAGRSQQAREGRDIRAIVLAHEQKADKA